jgi:hypothetical protein
MGNGTLGVCFVHTILLSMKFLTLITLSGSGPNDLKPSKLYHISRILCTIGLKQDLSV